MTRCYVNRAALPELGCRLTYCRFPKSSSRLGSGTADLHLCYSITNHDHEHVAFSLASGLTYLEPAISSRPRLPAFGSNRY